MSADPTVEIAVSDDTTPSPPTDAAAPRRRPVPALLLLNIATVILTHRSDHQHPASARI